MLNNLDVCLRDGGYRKNFAFELDCAGAHVGLTVTASLARVSEILADLPGRRVSEVVPTLPLPDLVPGHLNLPVDVVRKSLRTTCVRRSGPPSH